jgi:hypothetical protein
MTKVKGTKKDKKVDAMAISESGVAKVEAPVRTLKVYGDASGKFLIVPKSTINRFNLWGVLKKTALETQTQVCPMWNEEDTNPIIQAIEGAGYTVVIDETNVITGKSSLSRLPHYRASV